MQIENLDLFKKWIMKELTPMSDAEPEALANYVLALVNKNVPVDDLKKSSEDQLLIFLGDNTLKFVEKLFSCLQSKSYLDGSNKSEVESAATSKEKKSLKSSENDAETNKSLKTENSKSSYGRSQEKEQESSFSKEESFKSSRFAEQSSSGSSNSTRGQRKRISPPAESRDNRRDNRDRRRSRSPRDRRRVNTNRTQRSASNEKTDRERHRNERRRSRSRSSSRSPCYRRSDKSSDNRRRRCLAFEEKGYCIRGETCPYYHGPDPVVVDENALSNIVTIPAANFTLPPPGYNPVNPPPPGVGMVMPQSVTEYNPEAPALTMSQYSVPPPPISTTVPAGQWHNPNQPSYVPQSTGSIVYAGQQPQHSQSFRGGSSVRGNRGARGGRGGSRGAFSNNVNRDSSTLQVAKIPVELNNIAKLNEHFAEFGNIVNIQVQYNGDSESALITYSNKSEAMKAYKSPTPVLNNRFIKVFWHKPPGTGDENTPAAGQTNQAPEKPAEKQKIASVKESKFVSAEVQNNRKLAQEAKEKLSREKEKLSILVGLQEKQNAVLEKWMQKQKTLLTKARSTTNEDEKKNAVKLVKQIHKQIKLCKDEVDKILMQISEQSLLVDQAFSNVESLKASKKEGSPAEVTEANSRKRKASAGDDGIEETNRKMSSVIVVKNVKEADVSDLMTHMESFGETFDANIKVDDGLATAIFPYKKSEFANKALMEGKILNGVELDMELTNEIASDVPSTDTNMSANQLLAAMPNGIESDDDDILNE